MADQGKSFDHKVAGSANFIGRCFDRLSGKVPHSRSLFEDEAATQNLKKAREFLGERVL